MKPKVRIERPVEWQSEHDHVEVEWEDEPLEILSANRHGYLHVGEKDNPQTVNIANDNVTVL